MVGTLHSGLEHRLFTRALTVSIVGLLKLSLLFDMVISKPNGSNELLRLDGMYF